MISISGGILLVSATSEVEELMSATGARFVPMLSADLPDHPAVLEQLAGLPRPVVVVLDGLSDPAGSRRLVAALTVADPLVAVILVLGAGDDALEAIRSGARDVVVWGSPPEELRTAIDRALRSARQLIPAIPRPGAFEGPADAEPTTGRIVTVVSPKGGVGKTTVATNLAVGLAQAFPGKTVLVDLDIQFGDVASALDLEPEYFLPDTVQGQASQDSMALKTILTEHKTGLYVICAPDSPVEADSISGDDVARLLRMLASEFRYVVVDTAPGLSEHTLSALDETTDLVLLSSMEVPGVRGLRKELDTLSQLGLLTENRQVVINFAEPHGLLGIADIEATIKTSVDLQLPRSKAAADSVNQGVPLLQSGVRDPLTKQLRLLVTALMATRAGEPLPVPPALISDSGPRSARPRSVQARRAASRWSRTRKLVAK